MFTGIIEETGTVEAVTPTSNGRRIAIRATRVLENVQLGDSIAIDGVCQTVVKFSNDRFEVEAIGTTLERTTVGEWQPGRQVNLERALALGARLGGHLVQGHVDGTGTVLGVRREGEHVLVDVALPEVVAEVTVLHGSITIDGVSLTVNARPAPDCVQVALIPFTWQHTNLQRLAAGMRVNLEGDMLGRFVVDYLKRREQVED